MLGIPAVADEQGRVYPMSNAAASVLDILRLSLGEYGGCEVTGFDAADVRPGKQFAVRSVGGETRRYDRVIVACGGSAAPKSGGVDGGYRILKSLGHKITPVVPVIAPVNTETGPIKGLKGIRVRCRARLLDGEREVRSETGEVLFADYGLSGICIMQLAGSVHGLKAPVISLNLAPEMTGEGVLFTRARAMESRALEDFLNGIVQRRVGWNILRAAGVTDLARTAGSLSRRETSAVFRALTDFSVKVESVCGLDAAQATAGGAHMSMFDPETLMSRSVPGLYAAGEVCDVDGDCGGYNLHWAWSSALAVAEGILNG